jgi:hypothetical protein
MPQDFIPPLIYSESPLDGDTRVGRASGIHLKCTDTGTSDAELDPSTLRVSVHYRPEDEALVNQPWPQVVVYENQAFLNTVWSNSSTIDFRPSLPDIPTDIDLFLRRDTLAPFGQRIRVRVTVADKANNSSTREMSYGFVENKIYSGDDPHPLEETLLDTFGVPEIDDYILLLYTSLIDPTGLDANKIPYLATRRALGILSVLNMKAALLGLFDVDESLMNHKVENALSLNEVLVSPEILRSSYENLRSFLLRRSDLCPNGYLEFANNSILSTKPQTVLGAYITLWLVLCAYRISRETVSAG